MYLDNISLLAPESNQRGPDLSSNLKDLYMLWKKYEIGISGQKAAKAFTAEDHKENKFLYCYRELFWERVCRLLPKG